MSKKFTTTSERLDSKLSFRICQKWSILCIGLLFISIVNLKCWNLFMSHDKENFHKDALKNNYLNRKQHVPVNPIDYSKIPKNLQLKNIDGPTRQADPICDSKPEKVSGLISAVLPVASKNLKAFKRLQESLKVFFTPGEIVLYVIVPPSDLDLFSREIYEDFVVLLSDYDVIPQIEFMDLSHYGVAKGDRYLKRSGWVVQQLIKLAMSKIVQTEYYILLDGDCVMVRPSGYNDFIRNGKAITNIGKNRREIGQFNRWLQWGADTLGAHIENPNFGVTPAVFSRTMVASLIQYIENRYTTFSKDWIDILINEVVEWTEYGLYYTFAETTLLFDKYHVACEGLLYSYVLWAKYDDSKFHLDDLFRQSYSIFTLIQSIKKFNESTIDDIIYHHLNVAKFHLESIEYMNYTESKYLLQQRMLEAKKDSIAKGAVLEDDTAYTPNHNYTRVTQAWVSFVANDEYAFAACVMGHSISISGSKRKKLILITESVSNNAIAMLKTVFDEVRRVDHIPNPNIDKSFRDIHNPLLSRLYPNWKANDYHSTMFSKMAIWNLTEFSKVIYLDPDLLIVKPIDDLFKRPPLTAAPDLMPPDTFNTGVMVIEPDNGFYKFVLRKINHVASYNGGDQGLMNRIFPTWYQLPSIHRLPYTYSAQTRIRRFTITAWVKIAKEISILHYSPNKPWKDINCEQDRYQDLNKLWWKAFQYLYANLTKSEQVLYDVVMAGLNLTLTDVHRKNIHIYNPIADLQNNNPFAI